MGRRTSALAQDSPVAELAQWLEALRQQAGLSYLQMAQQVQGKHQFSAATYWRAVRGSRVPRWPVVDSFVRACHGDAAARARAHRLWDTAARLQRPVAALRTPALDPMFVTNPGELRAALLALHRRAGCPSLRDLERRATVHGVTVLPHSTLGAVLRGERMPSEHLLAYFIAACGVPTAPPHVWEQARLRARAYRRENRRARLQTNLVGVARTGVVPHR
ncbi:helix-turn-helix transcriptional regulator [Streptomyces sp. NPDC002766]|uniref:helix-turn-helix domain-containing protein n=1 Tax=Streptomyces sp. NPDC002766 TaxID=3154429 RepID=UPI003316B0B8